jgi:4-alpha-glucanotransferase
LSPDLLALAEAWGVLPSYTDMHGQPAPALEGPLRATLAALGSPVELGIPEAIGHRQGQTWGRELDVLAVVPAGAPGTALWIHPNRPAALEGRIELESGEIVPVVTQVLDAIASAEVGGVVRQAWPVPLPALPAGIHTLVLGSARAVLVSAPPACYRPEPDGRKLGIFLPHHALADANTLGLGDYRALRRLGVWAASHGATVLGTLPLLPTFLGDSPYEPSPYAPVSRRFWAEHLIDPRESPEWAECTSAHAALAAADVAGLRAGDFAEPAQVWALLRRLFSDLADLAWRTRGPELADWATTDPERAFYARFRAATERWGPWPTWESTARAGSVEALPSINDADVRTWIWAQHEAERQLRTVRNALEAAGGELYLDLPIGVHPDGYDAWRHQAAFARGCSAGAPPDPYFPSGQDWGFPPVHPSESRRTGHEWLRQCLDAHCAMAHRVRIDHVMGLYRLYWVSPSFGAKHGVYVRYPAEEFFAMLALASQRHRCAVVGENLGMVPPEVDRALERRKIAGIHVGVFSIDPTHRPAYQSPRAGDVSSLDTHDTPTFAGWWEGLDLHDHVALGWMNAARATDERRGRAVLAGAIADAALASPISWPEHGFATVVSAGLTATTCRGPAGLVLVNLEDLWGETRPHNVPGTWRELPNWRRRTARTLEHIMGDPAVEAQLRAFAAARSR